MSWTSLFHLGDLALTLSTASAIAAWLLAGRNWRAAARWCAAFGLTLGIVAASKIAFLGWETGIPALQFKALSGHAAGYAVTWPTLCRLLARGRSPRARAGATLAALAFGIVVALALVADGQHTAAEAAGGWLLGATAALSVTRALDGARAPAFGSAFAASALTFVMCAWVMGAIPVGYWMIRMALALSGNGMPYPWERCG